MEKYYGADGCGRLRECSLWEVFPFLEESGHVISLVGAGGKTTLMMSMARACSSRGMRVLVSTTTHILAPRDGSYARDRAQVRARWAAGRAAVVGRPAPEGKLAMLPPEALEECMDGADVVLLEADGARRLPLKVPAEGEPVLLPRSDIVAAVCGLGALDRPLGEVCFRLDRACALLGKGPGAPVTEEDAARILASEAGGRKGVGDRAYYPVLNQCDDGARLERAGRVAGLLAGAGIGGTAGACLLG